MSNNELLSATISLFVEREQVRTENFLFLANQNNWTTFQFPTEIFTQINLKTKIRNVFRAYGALFDVRDTLI